MESELERIEPAPGLGKSPEVPLLRRGWAWVQSLDTQIRMENVQRGENEIVSHFVCDGTTK